MDYSLLVNKDNKIPAGYEANLIEIESEYKSNVLLEENTYRNFKRMQEDALLYGYKIDVMSGYRSYDYQEKLYNKLLNGRGFSYAFRSVAKPGYSEHQTGLAIDFCIYRDDNCYIEHDITDMLETKWVHQNCSKYGFIVRYPLDKEEITKYNYEPWHLRYVGEIANYIYNNDLTLEEYKKKELLR